MQFDGSRGNPLIGVSNTQQGGESTLPPISEATPPLEIINYLVTRLNDLETLVEGKADKDQIKTEIAYSDEGVKIAGEQIVLFGEVTIADIVNDQRGESTGTDITLTRIIGDRIQTGVITSNNWGASEGTAIDLDNETLTLGGSSSPELYYDGAGNLTIRGTLNVGSTISGSVTVDGTTLSTISSRASSGYNIQQQLEVSGSTILAGTIEPQNTGGIKVGSITWNSTTGALTGGSGVAITENGLIAAESGNATVTITASSGSSNWAGDINTLGDIKAEGATLYNGATATIVALGGVNTMGIYSSVGAVSGTVNQYSAALQATNWNSSEVGIIGEYASTGGISNGAGVEGISRVAGVPAVRASGSGSGTGRAVYADGTSVFTGIAYLNDGIDVTGDSTIDGDLTIGANSTLTVDRSAFFCTDEQPGASSVVVGNSTATGDVTLIITKGANGSQRTDEIHFCAEDSADSTTTFSIVTDQNVTVGTSPVPSHRVPIIWNGVEYWLYLESR